jgi:FKBP-type peptidyl-prolyl cis-trans isomerase FkpA
LALALVAGVALAKVGNPGIETTASGLRYKVVKPGEGPHPTDTDVALVKYVGKLADGSVFDKSDRPVPLPVKGVVPGFSEGLKLMSKGGAYRLWIKPELGYGAAATGPIPANSTLEFDVELIDFIDQATLQQQMMQQQMMQGGAMPGGPGAAGPGGR